jgi:hypothetical protein
MFCCQQWQWHCQWLDTRGCWHNWQVGRQSSLISKTTTNDHTFCPWLAQRLAAGTYKYDGYAQPMAGAHQFAAT